MAAPFVSYITFNRLGLTVKSLTSILNNRENFELHIIDNNSADNTWEYLQTLKDSRIKSKTRLPVNAGQINSLNLNLTKRRPDQYFIALDNDVIIESQDWITRILNAFKTFPEVGLLSVMAGSPPPAKLPPVIPVFKNSLFYLELSKDSANTIPDCFPQGCLALRPQLINEIGYWSEENYFGNPELVFRVNRFTSFKAGILADISMSLPPEINCVECQYKEKCKLNQSKETCFSIYNKFSKNDLFRESFKWKMDETVKDMQSKTRPVYCASLYDYESMSNRIFNMDWAIENIKFFVDNAN